MNYKKDFTPADVLVVVGIIGLLALVFFMARGSPKAKIKERDLIRISNLQQLSNALELYFGRNGQYPTCLKPAGGCITTLSGSGFISSIPVDPLSNLPYSYAAIGSAMNCSGYHLGVSLEDRTNMVLLTGADSPVKPVCTGSADDFSGLSYAAGGQPCNASVGIGQPTTTDIGETCYDISAF